MARDIEKSRFLPNLAAIADYLGCSKRTVQRYMRETDFPALSSGRNQVTCTPDALDRWLGEVEKEAV